MKTLPSLASTRIFEVVSAKNEVLQRVVALEGDGGEIGDMALQRADPALLRDDDGHRLALDHRLGEVGDDDIRRGLEGRAPLAELGVGAVFLLECRGSRRAIICHCFLSLREQRLDLRLLLA